MTDGEEITVECYSGSTYADRPASFGAGGERHIVKEITRYWREPGLLGFSVITRRGELYDLVYYGQLDRWFLRRKKRDASRAGRGPQPQE